MDKEKQIKEMASDMDYACTKRDLYPIDAKEIAKALYILGYRKINENEVVISKEEYEKLKHFEKRVRSGVCLTQKEWFDFCNEDSNRRTCLRIEEREQARKETAEKIFKKLKVELKGYIGINYLEDLAKEFSVDLGEEDNEY